MPKEKTNLDDINHANIKTVLIVGKWLRAKGIKLSFAFRTESIMYLKRNSFKIKQESKLKTKKHVPRTPMIIILKCPECQPSVQRMIQSSNRGNLYEVKVHSNYTETVIFCVYMHV